jgi:O-antigen ligase
VSPTARAPPAPVTAPSIASPGLRPRRAARIHIVGALRAALLVLLAGNLVRLPALSSGAREAPISVNDLAVLTVLGLGVLAALQARRLVLDGVARRALLFAVVGGASAAYAVPRFGLTATELVFSLAYLARWLLYFGLYVVAINALRRHDVEPVRASLEGVILIFAAFGVVQSIFLPGFAQLVYPESMVYLDWDPQGHRLVSTFLDPNYAGAFVVIGLVLGLARLSCGDRAAGPRVGVLALALVLTASRSSMLAAAVGAAVVAAAAGLSRRMLRVAIALGVCALAALPALLEFGRAYGKLSIDASALQRVVSWLRALRIVGDHPFIGVGFNTYGFVQRAYGGGEAGRAAFSYSLDGGLLFIAVMTGLVGTAVYVAMLGRVARAGRRVWRDADAARRERALAIGAVAATVAVLVHSVFVNSLLHPFLMEPLWLLWAMVTVLARSLDAERYGAP